ncbi:hypothetical protein BVY03_05920 [bacterium K02(2017)]|nr:hypothetical protein BVY03_05920 [bacterium K02(2017)]
MSCNESISEKNINYYTCPMHPQIRMDSSGQCPICGMDLIAIKKNASEMIQLHSDHKKIQNKIVKIDPRYTQNIGVKTEKVVKRDLIQEILTYGKVAHDHNLWVAQNEFIQALKLGDFSLIKASERKLKFLGLSEDWIKTLKKNRSADISLHLESKGQPSFFEAYVYQEDIEFIKEGLEAIIIDQKGRYLETGHVKAIGTLVDLNSRSVRVLVEAPKPLNLKLNTFIQVKIKIPLGNKISVSAESILFNGNHNMVYVKVSKGQFSPRIIQVGQQAGDYYEVYSGLNENELVVTNGHFLIDSETKIKLGDTAHQH